MRRCTFRGASLLIGSLILAGATAAACSSSSSTSSTPTPASAAATSAATSASVAPASTSSASTAAPTTAATTAAPGGTKALPSDVCTLLSDADASQLAGTPVTGHTAPAVQGLYRGGTTAACHYYGTHGTGDHPVNVQVTSFADATAAHTFMQGQATIFKVAPGYQSLSGLGDEAFQATSGGVVQVLVRVGSLALLVNAGNQQFPGPSPSVVASTAGALSKKL